MKQARNAVLLLTLQVLLTAHGQAAETIPQKGSVAASILEAFRPKKVELLYNRPSTPPMNQSWLYITIRLTGSEGERMPVDMIRLIAHSGVAYPALAIDCGSKTSEALRFAFFEDVAYADTKAYEDEKRSFIDNKGGWVKFPENKENEIGSICLDTGQTIVLAVLKPKQANGKPRITLQGSPIAHLLFLVPTHTNGFELAVGDGARVPIPHER